MPILYLDKPIRCDGMLFENQCFSTNYSKQTCTVCSGERMPPTNGAQPTDEKTLIRPTSGSHDTGEIVHPWTNGKKENEEKPTFPLEATFEATYEDTETSLEEKDAAALDHVWARLVSNNEKYPSIKIDQEQVHSYSIFAVAI